MAEKISKKDLLINWLHMAHMMEVDITEMLKNHSSDAKDYPEVQSKIDEHIKITESQILRLEECIEELGGDISEARKGISKVMGKLGGMMNEFIPEKHEVLMNGMMDHAVEHFEMAVYKAISIAAKEIGEDMVVDVALEIMDEELEMANWLDENLETVVKDIVNKQED
jgi:ferritin-like metal-binding protein YciE